MNHIPIRYIRATKKEPPFSEHFSIRDIQDLLAGEDMVQELHRHDFFYILALEKGKGKHEIDFISYEPRDHTVFFMSPGQVHQLLLKADSIGYLIQFKTDFYYGYDKLFNQHLRKAASVNFYQLNANSFKKLQYILSYIIQEYVDRQENYHEVIKANLGILFIELLRESSKNRLNTILPYTQERLEEFLALLETHISSHK